MPQAPVAAVRAPSTCQVSAEKRRSMPASIQLLSTENAEEQLLGVKTKSPLRVGRHNPLGMLSHERRQACAAALSLMTISSLFCIALERMEQEAAFQPSVSYHWSDASQRPVHFRIMSHHSSNTSHSKSATPVSLSPLGFRYTQYVMHRVVPGRKE